MSFLKSLPFILLLTPLLISGCKSSRGLTETPATKERSSKFLLKKLNQNRIAPDWITAKVRVVFSDEKQTKKFTSNLRARKDSLIWMNFKKTSIEAARLLIRRDSFYLLNRLDKQYAIVSLNRIINQLGPSNPVQTDSSLFRLIQEVLLGNPYFYQVKSLTSSLKGGNHYLSGSDGTIRSEYWISGGNYLLKAMRFTNLREGGQIEIELDEYAQLGERNLFSYLRKITLSAPGEDRLYFELRISKAELNVPKGIIFEIPDHYERVE